MNERLSFAFVSVEGKVQKVCGEGKVHNVIGEGKVQNVSGEGKTQNVPFGAGLLGERMFFGELYIIIDSRFEGKSDFALLCIRNSCRCLDMYTEHCTMHMQYTHLGIDTVLYISYLYSKVC